MGTPRACRCSPKARTPVPSSRADINLSARDVLRVGAEYQQYRLDDWWPPSGTGGMAPNTFLNINDGERDRLAAFAEWEAQWDRSG